MDGCSRVNITEVCYFYLAQAGNVVTGEMVEELILAGADIIKVGIGPGDHGSTLINTFLRLYRSFSHLHLKHMSTLMFSVHLRVLFHYYIHYSHHV